MMLECPIIIVDGVGYILIISLVLYFIGSVNDPALCFMNSGNENVDVQFDRSISHVKPTYQRFILKKDMNFARQYSHIYMKRARALRELVISNIKKSIQAGSDNVSSSNYISCD